MNSGVQAISSVVSCACMRHFQFWSFVRLWKTVWTINCCSVTLSCVDSPQTYLCESWHPFPNLDKYEALRVYPVANNLQLRVESNFCLRWHCPEFHWTDYGAVVQKRNITNVSEGEANSECVHDDRPGLCVTHSEYKQGCRWLGKTKKGQTNAKPHTSWEKKASLRRFPCHSDFLKATSSKEIITLTLLSELTNKFCFVLSSGKLLWMKHLNVKP